MTNLFNSQFPTITGELHVAQIAHYAQLISAMESNLGCSCYLFDYQKKTFAYIPDGSPFLSGYSKAEVIKRGWTHYQSIMDAAVFEEFQTVNRAAYEFYQNIALEQRIDYTLDCYFKMTTQKGANLLVKHSQTPIIITNIGDIWLSLCTIRPAVGYIKEAHLLRNTKQACDYEYNQSSKTFERKLKPNLNSREVEILQMLASGFTESHIAELLFISSNTVKYYKKNIVKKLNTDNIKEAISTYIAS